MPAQGSGTTDHGARYILQPPFPCTRHCFDNPHTGRDRLYLRSYATMKKAAAIVTNRGGRTCHAAIVSRELGLPAVVGTERGTELLHDGQDVTVSGAEGDTGFVYEGLLDFDVDRQDLRKLERPKTKIMMNVGNPEAAFRLSFVPNDGVGLAREEFIISIYIKVHPMALLDYKRLEDTAVRAEIDRLTAGYDDKAQFFIDSSRRAWR